LVIGATPTEIVKLVLAVLAEIVGSTGSVSHVTASLAPNPESNVIRIWLLAVTAVVLTTTLDASASITTDPAAADPQAAAPALSEQLPAVR
jgi:hypothetical protein